MHFRPSQPVSRPALIALCLILSCAALAVLAAATAQASEYEVRACSGGVGAPPYTLATNTISLQHPETGTFTFADHCDRSGGDTPGNEPFMRIAEDEGTDTLAPFGAYLAVEFTPPAGTRILRAGGYTREPYTFNGGWQAHFKFTDPDGVTQLQMAEGAGLFGAGFPYFDRSLTFTPHLWPWPYGIQLDHWAFDLICDGSGGCDEVGYNAADLTGLVFTLEDTQDSQVHLTDAGSDLLAGRWVSGRKQVAWTSFDRGSGLRLERLRVDGSQRYALDYRAIGDCQTDASGQWAATFQPCPTGGPNLRTYDLDTASLPDGPHNLSVCTQDFAQYQGLNGTGSQTCETRTVRTDNHAPSAPAALRVITPDRNRYRSHFAARFALPGGPGSPIVKAHYQIVDPSGRPVTPARALTATDSTEIPAISGPDRPGAYRLRVWLQDAVGHVGRPAEVDIPHDSKPPAAPQGLTVTPPSTSRAADGFDLRWHDLTDAGSPIDAAHYQVLDASGAVAVPTRTVRGRAVQEISHLQTPRGSGRYTLRLWLSDAEGNVGAPVTAPLAYRCSRSAVPGGTQLTASIRGRPLATVHQGRGAALTGSLRSPSDAPVQGAALCVFSRVATDPGQRFLGVAHTDAAGNYRFAVGAGPSRELSVLYRPGHRRLRAATTLRTIVHPTLRARSTVVANGHWAHLQGRIPGPHADKVVVVLQVRQGKGWLAFRRYRTRGGGRYHAAYHFRRTNRPTTYRMRAQVRQTTGYPYLQGESDPLALKVVPRRHVTGRCPKAKRALKRVARRRCLARKRCARARRALRRHARSKLLRRRADRLCARVHRKPRSRAANHHR